MKLGNEIIREGTETLIYIGEMKSKSQVDDVLACSMVSEAMDEHRRQKILNASRVFTASYELLEVVETFLENYEGLKKVNNPEDSYAIQVWSKLAEAAREAVAKAKGQNVLTKTKMPIGLFDELKL